MLGEGPTALVKIAEEHLVSVGKTKWLFETGCSTVECAFTYHTLNCGSPVVVPVSHLGSFHPAPSSLSLDPPWCFSNSPFAAGPDCLSQLISVGQTHLPYGARWSLGKRHPEVKGQV